MKDIQICCLADSLFQILYLTMISVFMSINFSFLVDFIAFVNKSNLVDVV